MNFKIGQVLVKVSLQEWIVIVAPIGSQMIALKAELFRVGESNSVSMNVEVYNPSDVTVVDKVRRWMEE